MATATVVTAGVGLAYTVASWHVPLPADSFGFRGFNTIIAAEFGAIGLILALKRPNNPIGWLFLTTGGGSTHTPPATAPGCRRSRIGWTRSAERSSCARAPEPEPRSRDGCPARKPPPRRCILRKSDGEGLVRSWRPSPRASDDPAGFGCYVGVSSRPEGDRACSTLMAADGIGLEYPLPRSPRR
jgi:hypothetical protein